MAKVTASMASLLCSEDAAMITLGSLMGTILQQENATTTDGYQSGHNIQTLISNQKIEFWGP